MPIALLILLMLVVALAGLVWLAFGLLGMALTLVVAAAVGWLADRIVPGRLPYGWLGATAAGLLGAWLGQAIIGRVGPVVARIPVLPALLGAVLLAAAVELVGKGLAARRRRADLRDS